VDASDYCREIEAYLCRRNDGHLIRVVGPSFDLVSGWAAAGVPLSIACRGIDRYFERYYRKGPRRRPVRIDFCEADVLDAFDEWRRAVGLPAGVPVDSSAPVAGEATETPRHPRGARTSVPAHIERALLRLTDARTGGRLSAAADDLIDRLGRELEAARGSKGGVRGDARRELLVRLAALDSELVDIAMQSLPDRERRTLEEEATRELQPFSHTMSGERYRIARDAAVARLVRDRAGLPTIHFG
jgi:hypothetical protein